MEFEGKELSDEDKFYLDWGRDTVKYNISLVNDVLKQLVGISSALLGVGLVYDELIDNGGLRLFVLICFFLTLGSSFWGLLPYERAVDPASPSEIKEFKNQALKHKKAFLLAATILMTIGFLGALSELIYTILTTIILVTSLVVYLIFRGIIKLLTSLWIRLKS